jgi:NADPH:quinone reductase-like Zn-dependent oxidoreductase
MRAAFVRAPDPADPLAALVLGDRPEPCAREGWARIRVRAASLNQHDVFALRGVGIAAGSLPMILGCDAAGLDDTGRPVVAHAVLNDPAWTGPPLLDPMLSVLSEREQGTFAELVTVPAANLVPLPDGMGFHEAACLPTAWVTAYHVLFCQARLGPGDTLLVQGATGGLAAAAVKLATNAGVRVWATSRRPGAGEHLLELGAEGVLSHGARLPVRVDAVIDGIGTATWSHSLRSLRPGGTLVAVGGVTGFGASTDLGRIIRNRLHVVGSMMGCKADLEAVVDLCARGSVVPPVDEVIELDDLRRGLRRMVDGALLGKIVVSM